MQPQPRMASAPQGRRAPVAGWFITLFGLMFSLVGIGFGIAQQSYVASLPARTTGTVIDYALSMQSRGWHLVVRFTTRTGEPVQFTASTGTKNPDSSRIGEQVTVAYDPANPRHAAIDSFSDIWLIPLALAGVGLLFFLLGLGICTGRLTRIDTTR